MSRFAKKESKTLREKYLYAKHESGMNITVVEKKLPHTFAIICCDFGAEDLLYEKDGRKYKLPAGTAHFLEHKMFENADGSDSFYMFSQYGANANAFTSFENTCYYFSCTENFYENLEILLSAVSKAHFTKSSIDKERRIITREIKMYEDVPSSKCSLATFGAMYEKHPLRMPISGTESSVKKITKDVLYRAFDDFYVPENLSLCVCGEVDEEKIYETVSKYFKYTGKKRPKTLTEGESAKVCKSRVDVDADVAGKHYAIGIKCAPPKDESLNEDRHATAVKMGLSLLFGMSSDFYNENHALLNEDIYFNYSYVKGAAYVMISGTSDDPEEAERRIIEAFESRAPIFFDEEQFRREKRACFAEDITLFDSAEETCAEMAESVFSGYDPYDCREVVLDITAEEVRNALSSTIDISNRVLCVTRKKQ